MIDFHDIQIDVNEKYSFVGIERRNGTLRFCLPKGFNPTDKSLQTFDAKRDWFFRFYQIFERFKEICIEKGYLDENDRTRTADRDGVIRILQGSEISTDDDEEENLFYSKLDLLKGILNAYDEPKILSLGYRLGKSEVLDYSQFHRFLHRAVFLPNGTAYIDYMNLPRQHVQFESTDIVAMYCYLLCEIKQQLNQYVRAEIRALAERFSHNYIGGQYSLFQEQYYKFVIDILKDALEIIHRNTPLKDADYWDFYEAIELFLYGELHHKNEGEVWGIKNFHSVWESMCLTYLAKTHNPRNLLYLDTQLLSDSVLQEWNSTSKPIDLSNTFQVNGQKLIPDAVVFDFFSHTEKYWIARSSWDDYGSRISFLFQDDDKFYTKKVISTKQKSGSKNLFTNCITHSLDLLEIFYQKS
ncbi:hypothetical protein LKK83_07120, partial [Phormidium sp. CCY1219]|nr:hypothetical protein [Phormidium sp. CCY1219]